MQMIISYWLKESFQKNTKNKKVETMEKHKISDNTHYPVIQEE